MNTSTNERGTSAVAVMVACTLFVAGCLSPYVAMAADTVTAKGDHSIAAGRDVNIEKNTTIKEYDLDKARRIKVSHFASDMHRDCVKYVDRVHAMRLERRPDEPSDGEQPFIFSGIYQSPDTRSLLGESAYKVLNSQQERLKEVNGEISNMRLMHSTAKAREMMAKMGNGITIPGVSGPEPTQRGFESRKSELERLTVAHCQYLKSLM